MSKQPRDHRPYIPPVQKVPIPEGSLKLRWMLLAMALAIAAISLGMGIHYALTKEPGWQQVESISGEMNCADDFVFMYECGTAGVSATSEYKGVTALYTRLTQEGYELFTAETESELHNVYFLNQNVNQTVTVEPALYGALALMNQYGCRDPFLAPVAAEYSGVFLADTEEEAAFCDPSRDPQRGETVREILEFAGNPEMVSVKLMGNNRVRLNVAEAYLTFAEENDISVFLDFGWMKNAFIADYLAENLKQGGYTNGYLASYDGFTRNLDTRGGQYLFNIFDRMENTIAIPASMPYTAPMSIVFLRNYPLDDLDRWHYRAYADGSITSVYLEQTTGMPVSSTDNLVSYSTEMGCGEILMHTAPIYLARGFDEDQVRDLSAKGIHSIWAEENVLFRTQEAMSLKLLPESGGADYRLG